jgi:small subunit ribosomal protein S18
MPARTGTPTRGRRSSTERPQKRTRHLDDVKEIDYRDYDLLRKFVTEHGKIIPARLTGANPKQQRQIKRAVRRARNIGLLA